MEKVRITDKRVSDALDVRRMLATEKEEWLTDSDVKGFQIRLTKTGKALAYLQYWVGGKGGRPRKLTLGEIGKAEDGKLTVVEARKKASAARGAVDAGGDPWADKKLHRDKLAAETFKDAWEAYKAAKGQENRTWTEYQRLIEFDAFPTIGDLPIATITEAQLAGLISKCAKRKPSIGRALFAVLRPFFKWVREHGLLKGGPNPMRELTPPKPLKARERHLDEREFAAFWRSTEHLGWPWKPIYRLLALTGTRREEVASMEWRELDLEAATWTIPTDHAKNKQFHVIDLPPLAVEILRSVPKIADDNGNPIQLLFTTTGTTPPSGWSKAKAQLDGLMKGELGGKLDPWTTHDLRKTVVTTLTEAFGYSDELGDRLLNHKKKGITGVYNKATQREVRKKALLDWSNHISRMSSKNK